MVFCGESIITEISVYVFFYMSEFIIQSTDKKILKKSKKGLDSVFSQWYYIHHQQHIVFHQEQPREWPDDAAATPNRDRCQVQRYITGR